MRICLLYISLVLLISCQHARSDVFIIDGNGAAPIIYIAEDADDIVRWAAEDLAQHMSDILGQEVAVRSGDGSVDGRMGIYIATMSDGQIEGLPRSYDHLEGEWETYTIADDNGDLVIVGSDIRGTVYGISELSGRMGISPWEWWADVVPLRQEAIEIDLPVDGITEGPSVQYRGIFLNDEDWGLQPWAAKTFEPTIGDIGPKTYERIFQLLLRLKANTIWPAMHPCTKAFFSIPGNKEMAEKYHILIGTSHAEPMLRNNVDEWDEATLGEYNYFTNSQTIRDYWQERITATQTGENLITLGMRGIHDSGMKGAASKEEKVEILKRIISDQREMLTKTLERPIEDIPQMLIPYKEVLELYDAGLEVPDDVTIVWTDDNYGYIRRQSDASEQLRSGGSGVYYHISYWGRPHDNLWLSTTQPGLIWYEMSRAYHNGAKKIWIANVGDIKPAEYNMELFLDLAWDINSITASTTDDHLLNWCVREFGEASAREIASIFSEHYRLAFLRKPEYMGWSQTEPTRPTQRTAFTKDNNNEVQRRLDAYSDLVDRVGQVKSLVVEERQDAFFQLVEYPVKGAALMNYKFLYAQQALTAHDDVEKANFSNKAAAAYDDIKALTFKYNNGIADGKWQGMMSMNPRGLPVFEMPSYHLSEDDVSKNIAVSTERSMHPIFIQAADFVQSGDSDHYTWKSINGLGYGNASVTLFPLDHHVFENDAPYVAYRFDVPTAGKYEVEIRCLPTHSNNYNHQIWVEVDGKMYDPIALNTKGRSEAWKEHVLQNHVAAIFRIDLDKAGEHTVKVFVNQTGIVLDQIAINPESYPAYYEIVK